MSETQEEGPQAASPHPQDVGLRARIVQGLRSAPSSLAPSAVAASIAVALNQTLLQMGITLPTGSMLPSDWAAIVQALSAAGQATTNVGLNLVANWLWERAKSENVSFDLEDIAAVIDERLQLGREADLRAIHDIFRELDLAELARQAWTIEDERWGRLNTELASFPARIADAVAERVGPDLDELKTISRETLQATARLAAAALPGTIDDTAGLEIQRYLEWVGQHTATFTIPGIGVPLPINDAWMQLRLLTDDQHYVYGQRMKDVLAAYRDWERLSYSAKGHAASDVTELGHRIVVVGGPGLGKSTLCRRAAHTLSASGERVLCVYLPAVSRRWRQGYTFEEALLHTATDGFVSGSDSLRASLKAPEFLLADGLDECDPHRQPVAEALARWALDRPTCRVTVTTRPVGHDPGLFEGWIHAELLPLEHRFIVHHATGMIRAITRSSERDTARVMAEFQADLDRNRVASLAARSPLLLSFLIQLKLAGVTLAGHRAALYGQIIDLWRRRTERDHALEIPSPLAHRSLDIMGWSLQQSLASDQGSSRSDLIAVIGQHLASEMRLSILAAGVEAEGCLAFWEQQGVVERLSVGNEEIYVFVHASLGEFAAARYALGLEPSQRAAWIQEVRRHPRWREPLLLAAGLGLASEITQQLLALEDYDDPAAMETHLAAAAVGEVDAVPPAIISEVIDRIGRRLRSPIPVVAYEAADAAVGLAAQEPALIEGLVRPLCRGSQIWTRLAAFRLALAARDEAMDFDSLEELFDERAQSRRSPGWQLGREWYMWNEVAEHGARALSRRRAGPGTVARLERLARSGHAISAGAADTLAGVLHGLGRPDLAQERVEIVTRIFEDLDSAQKREADRAFLEAVVRVSGKPDATVDGPRKAGALGALVNALGLQEVGDLGWDSLAERRDTLAVDAVLTGTVASLGLDLTQLATEAVWARPQLQPKPGHGLLHLVPHVPTQPQWHLAMDVEVRVEDLVRALAHPSTAIAFGAANLVASGVGGELCGQLVQMLLHDANDQTLEMISYIAAPLWGNRALDQILDRLDGELSLGCRWLLRALPDLPGAESDTRVLKALLRGINAEDSRVAARAAAALGSIDDGSVLPVANDLREALELWGRRGARCARCEIQVLGGSCTNCHVIPDSPRADLVRVLARAGAISPDELLALLNDDRHDVKDVARQLLPEVLKEQPERLPQIISGLISGQYNGDALDAILLMPSGELEKVRADLLDLLHSRSVSLKLSLMRALSRATWVPRETALAAAQATLQDENPRVRDGALLALRALYLADVQA